MNKCKKCGSEPTVVKLSKLFDEGTKYKYQAICRNCQFEYGLSNESQTELCKTPDNAIKRWNLMNKEN